MNNFSELKQLGWQPFFLQQLTLEEFELFEPARVVAHDRSRYVVFDGISYKSLDIIKSLPKMTVGDWLLIDEQSQFVRLLERKSLLSRRSAGSKLGLQLIASNIEALFIVSSLNYDFNLSRIERYLVLAREAEVEPIIVLTKADLASNKDDALDQLEKLDSRLSVFCVNALDKDSCERLKEECPVGTTVALLGSSGVGKSTITNTLLQSDVQLTKTIREDDSKGRHTTSSRSIHFIPGGGVLIDTPGMRELKITDCSEGLDSTFNDIGRLAKECKFADCSHTCEVGCAVLKALEDGLINPRRLANYQKLKREEKRNSMELHELRAKEKSFKKMVNSVTRKSNL